MNLTIIKATTIGDAWFQLLKEVMNNGHEYIISSGSTGTEGKRRRELDCAAIQITSPGVRPLTPDVPMGVPAPTSDYYIEHDYLPYLLCSDIQDNEEYTYGMYIEPQLERVLDMFESGPNTNQATITVGDKDSVYLVDPPCLRLIDLRIRYGMLHFMVYFRSWDCWGGLPTNLGGLQMMKETLARMLGVDDGELFAFSKGIHVYDSEWEVANMVINR